jgi:hypothetical protein
MIARVRGIHLLKALEDGVKFVSRNAASLITNGETDGGGWFWLRRFVAGRFNGEPDGFAAIGKLNCVAEQIGEGYDFSLDVWVVLDC